jgi:hypothetical protein
MLTSKKKSSVPDVVYHYTSMKGLLGIIEGCIWATNILYLSDISEYNHFLTLVKTRLLRLRKTHQLRYVSRVVATRKNRRPPAYMDVPFVASFTESRDSLAHWRSYCPQGNGVCIGLRTESIKAANLDKTHGGMCQAGFFAVEYLEPNDVKSLDKMIRKLSAESASIIEATESAFGRIASVRDRVGRLRAAFEVRAAMIKHSSFNVEREYRLLAWLYGQGELVSFRPSRSSLLPYLEMRLPDPVPSTSTSGRSRSSKSRFIDSVTIGPTPNLELSADAVLGILQSRGFDVPVKTSSVPFRDW